MLPVAVQHILIKQIRKDALYRDVIRDKCSNQCKEDGRTCIVLRAFLFDDGVCIATGTKAFRMINIPYPHHALYDVHVNLNLVVSRFSLAVGVIYHVDAPMRYRAEQNISDHTRDGRLVVRILIVIVIRTTVSPKLNVM